MASTGSEIIFLDHFKHPSSEGENQDMVRFPKDNPYTVEEIRIVPKGFPVKGPAKVITGLSNPATFELKVFLNNLNLANPSRCQWVGTFSFNEGTTHRFVPNARFPTDALVVRGKYAGLTLAILGVPSIPICPVPPKTPIQSIPKKGPPTSLAPIILQPQTRISVVPKSGNILASPSQLSSSVPVSSGAPIPTIGRGRAGPPIPIRPHSTLAAVFDPSVPPPVVSGSSMISTGTSQMPGMFPPPQGPAPSSSGVFFDPTRPPPSVVPSTPAPQPPAMAPTVPSTLQSTIGAAAVESIPSSRGSNSGRREKSKRDRKGRDRERDDRRSSGGRGERKEEEPRKRGRSEEKKEKRRETRSSDRDRDRDRNRRERNRRPESASRAPKKEQKEEPALDEVSRHSGAPSNDKFGVDLENISDEEFDYVDVTGEMELTSAEEDMLQGIVAGFDPFKFELRENVHMEPPWNPKPCLTEYEVRTEDSNESWVVFKKAMSNQSLVNGYEEASSEWVESIENLIPHLSQGLHTMVAKSPSMLKSAEEILLNWVTYGLDMEEAKKQTQPAFIIRHMKAGLRITSVLALHSSEMSNKLLEIDVQHRLADLLDYNENNSALTLRILKALEATVFYKVGMIAFLKEARLCYEGGPTLTSYQRLSDFAKRSSNSRVLVATRALVRKISCHETLCSLKNIVDKLVSEKAETEEDSSLEGSDISEEDGANAAGLLTQLLFVYRNAEHLLTLNRFQLTVSKIYEVRAPKEDPYPSIYQLMKSNCFLESLCVLCSCANGVKRVVSVVKQFMDEMNGRQDGLLFISSQPAASKKLLMILLQQDGDGEEGSPLSQVGLDLVHHLQAFQQLDELLRIRSLCSGDPHTYIDNTDAVCALQQLMKLTYTAHGRRAAVKVLGWKKNLDAILPFVELTGDPEVDSRARKSACAAYAADLLLLTIRCSDSIEMLQNFGDRLLTVSSQDSFSRIGDLRNWVEVLRKLPDYSVGSVDYVCDRIDKFMLDGVTPQMPKGLIVALRILKFLMEAPESDAGVEHTEELKYREALIKMYSRPNTFNYMLDLITKLVDSHLINWQQGLSFNNQDGQLFYACVLPALKIIRITITQLIRVRKDEFQDVTRIGPLVHLFTVCTTLLPAQSVVTKETKQIQAEVLRTLLAFTQPASVTTESTEEASGVTPATKSVQKSLWTRMLKEILVYREKSPYAFVGATTILAELLPVPLPIQSTEELSHEEEKMAVDNRRAWTAHLEPLQAELTTMITELLESSHPALQRSFRKLILFLSDMTIVTSRMVARAILNAAIYHMEAQQKVPSKEKREKKTEDKTKKEESETGTVKLPVSPAVSRVLDTMAYLCSQAPCKLTFLGLMRSEKECDAKYRKLIPYFRKILTYGSHDAAHNRSKECIVSMWFQFSDYEIMMDKVDKSRSLDTLFWSLPSKEQLLDMCSMLLEHLACAKSGFQITFVHTLRALLMTLEHDFGLGVIREIMLSGDKMLSPLLTEILREFQDRKKNPSSDCCASLNLTMDFIKTLLTAPTHSQDDDGDTQLRKIPFGKDAVRTVLGWNMGWNRKVLNDEHPLAKLAALLERSLNDDETMRSYLEPVTEVLGMLESQTDTESPENQWRDLEYPECPSLEEQFQGRQIWVLVSDVEEEMIRLMPHYWFPSTPVEDFVEEAELTDPETCDLEVLRQEVLPQFDPKEELLRRVSAKHVERPTKRPKHRVGIINTSRGEKKIMRPPLRGRGFIPRGNVAHRMNDPFRNRPQNTSRAPSMHVDDFLIMEIQSKTQDTQGDKGRSEGRSRVGPGVRGLDRRRGRSTSPPLPTIKERGGPRPNFPRNFHEPRGQRRGGGRGGMRFHGRNRDREYRPGMEGPRYSYSHRRESGRRSR